MAILKDNQDVGSNEQITSTNTSGGNNSGGKNQRTAEHEKSLANTADIGENGQSTKNTTAVQVEEEQQQSRIQRIVAALGLRGKDESQNAEKDLREKNSTGKALTTQDVADTMKKVTGHEMNDLAQLNPAALAAAAGEAKHLRSGGTSMAQTDAPVHNHTIAKQQEPTANRFNH
jgi:hypothetical protein